MKQFEIFCTSMKKKTKMCARDNTEIIVERYEGTLFSYKKNFTRTRA